MALNQEGHGISHDAAWLPKVLAKATITHLPDELLVEIFDFYRHHFLSDAYSYQWWSIELEWFKLIHVCRRWRTVMLASPSRLDLCFVLPKKGGHVNTIFSRHFPPLPIDIYLDCLSRDVPTKHMARIHSALKRSDRIRRIAFTGRTNVLDKLLKATKCPLPALESLKLYDTNERVLNIPATFLEGPHLRLQTLKLEPISLPSVSRLLLSSAPALTCLYLLIDTNVGPPPAMLLLSHLQGMPYLRRLYLKVTMFYGDPSQSTNSKENFTLSNLTYFRYHGHSAFLNTLISGFTAPSLRDIDIWLPDTSLYSIPHLSRYVDDIEEHWHGVQIDLEQAFFRFRLLGPDPWECKEHRSPHFRLCSHLFPDSMMQISNALYSKLISTEELSVSFVNNAEPEKEVIPWRRFFLQFPSVKTLHLSHTNNRRVASALYQDHGEHSLALLPALKKIELCMRFSSTPEDHASELAIFQPFVSARQQAGLPVKVVTGM